MENLYLQMQKDLIHMLNQQQKLMSYYNQKFQGDFNQVSQALSSNTVTANLYLYTPNFCADLYAWLIFNKSIPSNSKFILPQQYQKKCESIKYIQKPQQQPIQYTNILNDYESLIQKKLPTKIQHLRSLPQNPFKQYTKPIFKELLTKIKYDEPIQIKTSGQADYSMVERLSFSNLKELVKSANNQKGHIEKRYKNIYDIARQDCYPIEQIKKELRKNYKQQLAVAGQRIFPMQTIKYNQPPNSGPPNTQYQSKSTTIENMSAQTILMAQQPPPPQQQIPITNQQPLQQPPQIVQTPPINQTPAAATSRPRKTKPEVVPVQPPQQPPPVVQQTTSAKKINRKKDDQVAQPPSVTTPANVEPQEQPKQSKRTKKQTKANEKNKQQQPEDRKDDSV